MVEVEEQLLIEATGEEQGGVAEVVAEEFGGLCHLPAPLAVVSSLAAPFVGVVGAVTAGSQLRNQGRLPGAREAGDEHEDHVRTIGARNDRAETLGEAPQGCASKVLTLSGGEGSESEARRPAWRSASARACWLRSR